MNAVRMLLLRLFPYRGEIISTVAIIVTIRLSIGSPSKEKRSRTELRFFVYLIAIIVLGMLFMYENNNYCIMPDLYGASYDNAVEILRSAELNGHLALAATDKSINNLNARVIYQSVQKNKIVRKQSEVFFVLDDYFALEYNPIVSKISPIPSTNWSWELSENDDNLIYLRLPLGYENVFSPVLHGESNQAALAIADYTFSETLDKITEYYIHSNNSRVSETNHFHFVGKFFCVDDDKYFKLKLYNSNYYQGILLFPSILYDGNYVYSFAFFDDTGEYFEHSCGIIVNTFYK